MKHGTIATMMTVALALLWGSVPAQQKTLPMPPRFSADVERDAPLKQYPLGIIPKQAAFVRHGKADREVKLPNGKEGWVYEVRPPGQAKSYTYPSGQEKTVTERRESDFAARTYTLVFDDKGVVIDVLYNEHGRHDGLSAAALQAHSLVLPGGGAGGH
jgi:hypothetical protein